jgi:hypothetical protein
VPISDGILKFLDKEKKRTADVLLITQKGRTFSIFTTRDGTVTLEHLLVSSYRTEVYFRQVSDGLVEGPERGWSCQ